MLLSAEDATNLFDLIRSRKTVRSFKANEVPPSVIREILDVARTAPSTFNTQPWRLRVLAGSAKTALSKRLLEAHAANATRSFTPFPDPMPDEINARQMDFGRMY